MGRQKLTNNKVHCVKSLSHIHWTYLDVTWRSCMCERKCLKQWVVHAMCNVQLNPCVNRGGHCPENLQWVCWPPNKIHNQVAIIVPLLGRFILDSFSSDLVSWFCLEQLLSYFGWLVMMMNTINLCGAQQQLNHRKYSVNITHHSIVN